MTTEDNKNIAKTFIQELQNAKNFDIIDELLTDECLIHVGSRYVDRDKYKRIVQSNHQYFPDMHVDVQSQIAEGDKVVTQWKNNFTHSHDFLGLEPTFENMTISGVSVYQLVGSKISQIWIYFDRPIG